MQFFKNKKVLDRGFYESTPVAIIGRRKASDWTALIALFVLINLGVVGWSYYIYSGVESKGIFNVQQTEVLDTLDKNSIKNTIGYFDDRQKKFEALKVAKPTVVDPSL